MSQMVALRRGGADGLSDAVIRQCEADVIS
jgi:hypothetical protein